ncbi:hypothetical protein QYE76_050468 [Lolium multiflorum]|uniref:F-box/LRR-repeat protein 15/At3g58940/PEG3-like LRR domain-containing protein n=1 Tax=Lolium multiflorum TaxID=4521 RepID=A0AAD8SR94_LOLMU|nr:hypothetical protein QYE76_050468 [Lolium multiflorum]
MPSVILNGSLPWEIALERTGTWDLVSPLLVFVPSRVSGSIKSRLALMDLLSAIKRVLWLVVFSRSTAVTMMRLLPRGSYDYVRTLLLLMWSVSRLDVQNAFLNGADAAAQVAVEAAVSARLSPPPTRSSAPPTLKVLALSKCRLTDARVSAAAAHLTELTLSETSPSEAALQSALSSCPAIRTLIVKHVHGLQFLRQPGVRRRVA